LSLIIRLDNISVSYGKLLALDDISLSIEGGAVGLLGPNGAGKTTLLETLLGFLKPDTGSGEVLGMDIKTRQLEIRQHVGYMPEGECYIPGMNAVSFVAYSGRLCGMPYKDAMQRSHEVLQYIGMDEERYRMVETFSAGMKQRIKMAQALIHDPELLFLDEPTAGMDPTGRQEMLDLIKDISTVKSINIILSSHLLPDIEYACQDVVVMHQGKLIIQGNIEELKDTHRRLFEVKIKGSREVFTSALEKSSFEWWEAENDILRVALPDDIETDFIFKLAVENGLQIRHLAATRYSLEDVFAQAVGEE
jgi:ABC-2 type transport system ATP-binding protein